MQALRYSPPQSSLFTRPDSRALAVDLLLTIWHRPCCLKCHQLCTPCCCQPRTRNPAAYHSLAFSSWYRVLAKIFEIRCESSISWAIQAYKLVCLPGVIFEKNPETWLSACDSAWFWCACYSARPCCLERSFVTWHLCCGLTSEALVHDKGFIGRQSSILGSRRIVFPQIFTLSKD